MGEKLGTILAGSFPNCKFHPALQLEFGDLYEEEWKNSAQKVGSVKQHDT